MSMIINPYILGSFLPSQLSGLALWHDVSQLTPVALGTAVAPLTDFSGNGRDGVQATGGAQATYRPYGISGRPALRFQGGQHYQVSTFDLTGTSAVTLFVAFQASVGSDRMIFEFSTDINGVTDGFTLFRDSNNKAYAILKGGTGYSDFVSTNTITLTPTLVSAVFDKSLATNEVTSWLNGTSAGSRANNTNNSNAFGNRAAYIGKRGGTSLAYFGDLAEIILYNRSLTTPERQQVEGYLQTKYSLLSTSKRVICDGDSQTYGFTYATNPYPDQMSGLLGTSWAWSNYGVDGQTVSAMTSDAVAQIDPLYSASATKNIVVLWGGINDMGNVGGNQTAATTWSRIQTYAAARRAAGWKVAVCTCLARSDAGAGAGFEAKRQTLNTSIRAGLTTDFDAIADYATDVRLDDGSGTLVAGADSGDHLHLNNAGNGYVAALVNAAVLSL